MNHDSDDNWLFIERLRPLFELEDVWVWEIDLHGVLTFVGEQSEKFLGYCADELLGKSIYDLMPKLEQIQAVKIYQNAMKKRSNILHELNVKLHKKGYFLYLSTRAYPFFDTHGELVGYRGVDQNISKEIALEHKLNQEEIIRKQHEEELFLSRSELISKSQKEAFRCNLQFFSNMSKEIQKPMNEIVQTAQIAFSAEIDPIKRRYLEKIETSAKLLEEMMNDILDLSTVAIDELLIQKESFDLLKTLDDMMHLLDTYAALKGIKIDLSYGKDLKRYYVGDACRIRQLLLNILINAMKLTRVETIEFFVDYREGKQLYFEIKESDLELTSEQIDSFFKPYNEIDSLMVLGFTLSNALAGMMNGKFWIESNQGSRFVVEIEALEATQSEKLSYDTEVLEDLNNALRTLSGTYILLIEESLVIDKTLRRHLEKSEIFVDRANNAKEALKMCQDRPNRYELILIGIDNGVENVMQMRSWNQTIPIVALRDNSHFIETQHNAQIDDCIDKPIDIIALYKVLLKYIFPKSIASTKIVKSKREVVFPLFESIDTAIGLANNHYDNEIYTEELHNFREQYYGMYFQTLEDEELEEMLGALKNHSKEIGALKLHYALINYENYHTQEYLSKLYKELHGVIEEIEDKLVE